MYWHRTAPFPRSVHSLLLLPPKLKLFQRGKETETILSFWFSNQTCVCNDLFFKVFNINKIEKRVNDKYNIKNNITDGSPVFLAIKNHTSASTSSRRNFKETDTIEYMTWLLGCLRLPMKKIYRMVTAIALKEPARIKISVNNRLIAVVFIRRYPADIIKAFRTRSLIILLEKSFKNYCFLIKSFIAK